MKNNKSKTKSLISIILVMATILTMQGLVVGAADIANGLRDESGNEDFVFEDNSSAYEYTNEQTDIETPVNPALRLFSEIQKQIKNGTLSPITDETRIEEIEGIIGREQNNRDLTIQNFNVGEYVKDYTNRYLVGRGEESVDLSNLSLHREYSVGTIIGRNGIGTEIKLVYDLDESTNFAPRFVKTNDVVYYVARASLLIDVTNNVQTWGPVQTETYSTFNAAYYDSCHQNLGEYEYVENGVSYYYIELQFIDMGEYYLYDYLGEGKDLHSTNSQLSDGWRFNIPYIEVQTENGDNMSILQVLHLDNGMSINMKDYVFTNRELEDVTITRGTYSTSAGTATTKVVLLDGTTYYFNSDDDCIRKEDRYGNGINYTYDSLEGYLVSITADTGASVTFVYTSSGITVTSPDGSVVTIGITLNIDQNREVTSIDYGSNEIYTFEYSTSDYDVEFCGSIVDYVSYKKLTKVTEPSGTYVQYTYSSRQAGWGIGHRDYPVLASKSVNENNTTKYTVTYSATGIAYDSQSHLAKNELDYKYYVLVIESNKRTQYTFDVNNLCIEQVFSDEKVTKTYNEYYLPETVTTKVGSLTKTESYTYDSKGNVLTYTNPEGNVTTCTYSQYYGFLLSKTFGNLRVENTLSQDNKSISKVEKYWSNVLVNRADFTYDSYGNVLTETEYIYPGTGTRVTTYAYTDNVSRPTGINYNGMFATSKTISGVKDADNQNVGNIVTTMSYDMLGRVLSSTDAENNTTSFTYNTKGQLTAVTYPNNSTESYTYDAVNERVTHTDRSGYTLVTQYDYLGNVLTIKENSTNHVLQTNTYDIYGRTATSANYGSQSVTEYTYDIKDRVTSQKIKNSQGTVQYEEYYAYSVESISGEYYLKTQKTVAGDTNSPSIVTSEYVNKLGQLAMTGETIEGTEVRTVNTFDIYGNNTSVSRNGRTTSYTYDFNGKVLTETNALNNTTTYTYDNHGNILTITDALNGTVTYTYDTIGRRIKTTATLQTGVTNITKEYYNKNSLHTETKVTDNIATVYLRSQNTYDCMGNVTAVTQIDGNGSIVKTMTYDGAGRLLTTTVNNKTTTNTYDFRGNLSSSTDGLNHTETYVTDPNGLLTSKTDRNGTVFTYTYNALGKVLTETATNNNTTQTKTYTYAKTGLLRSSGNNGVVVTNTYDSCGRLISQTETGGIEHVYSYNSNHERTDYKLYINDEIELWEKYTYNALGQVLTTKEVKKVEPSSISQTGHQGNSILTSEGTVLGTYTIANNGNGDVVIYNSNGIAIESVSYTGISVSGEIYLDSNGDVDSGYIMYDGEEYDFGNIGSYDPEEMLLGGVSIVYYVTNSSGTITETILADIPHVPTPEGYMSWVYEGFLSPASGSTAYVEQTPFVTYTYDARGNILSETYNNGTSTEYTYYPSGLPQTMTNKCGNTTLSSFSYTYYPDGNIASVTENGGKVTYYSYDGYGRLVEERIVANNTTKVISYTYDDNGNRTSKTENGITTSYTYDGNNRLTTETTGLILTYYSYDNNGNLLSVLVGGNYTGAYTYDLFNREKSYTPNYVSYTYYTYRADGLRHSIGSTVHSWDGSNIVCDIDGTDYVLYFRAISLVFYRENSTDKYYLKNIQGDVIQLTNSGGVVVKSYTYDAYGEEKNPDSSDSNPFRYRGEYYDKVTKTIYLRARSYSASRGVFTTEDPIRDGDNWYGYCGGNPVNSSDPSGCVRRECDYVQCVEAGGSGYKYEEKTETPIPIAEPNGDDGYTNVVFYHEFVIEEIEFWIGKLEHGYGVVKGTQLEHDGTYLTMNIDPLELSASFGMVMKKAEKEYGFSVNCDSLSFDYTEDNITYSFAVNLDTINISLSNQIDENMYEYIRFSFDKSHYKLVDLLIKLLDAANKIKKNAEELKKHNYDTTPQRIGKAVAVGVGVVGLGVGVGILARFPSCISHYGGGYGGGCGIKINILLNKLSIFPYACCCCY